MKELLLVVVMVMVAVVVEAGAVVEAVAVQHFEELLVVMVVLEAADQELPRRLQSHPVHEPLDHHHLFLLLC